MAQNAFALLLGINFLFADVFIVSYQAQVKDSQILHQSLLASKAMTTPPKNIIKTQTLLLDKKCKKAQFFICYEEKILDFMFKEGVYIQARDQTRNLVNQSSFIQLNLPPQYLQVEFNDTFVKMALLK